MRDLNDVNPKYTKYFDFTKNFEVGVEDQDTYFEIEKYVGVGKQAELGMVYGFLTCCGRCVLGQVFGYVRGSLLG
jgi:hypothetical protein